MSNLYTCNTKTHSLTYFDTNTNADPYNTHPFTNVYTHAETNINIHINVHIDI